MYILCICIIGRAACAASIRRKRAMLFFASAIANVVVVERFRVVRLAIVLGPSQSLVPQVPESTVSEL